jgi:hypothetical protein
VLTAPVQLLGVRVPRENPWLENKLKTIDAIAGQDS